MSYLKDQGTGTAVTPQSEPIPDTNQVENRAGGFAWEVDDWERLQRFLVLGTEGGTYYASQRQLSRDGADVVRRCLKEDAEKTVGMIVDVSEGGRAPKNDPAVFALALAASSTYLAARQLAYKALPRVCRIGTHLFMFCEFIDENRGWSRGLRTAVGRWYDRNDLAYQLVKYRQREGWTHRDVLRLSHPKPVNTTQARLFAFACGEHDQLFLDSGEEATRSATAFRMAQEAEVSKQAALLVRQFGTALPREALQPEHLNDPKVWEALLDVGMPMTALLRNLATMTRLDVLRPLGGGKSQLVANQLVDAKRLKKARVHPVQVLSALITYQAGRGARGQHTWSPVTEIVNALDQAFYASFGNVEPTNKRLMLALDVSGSMDSGFIAGVPGLTPRVGSAAMALVTAATEPTWMAVGFTGGGWLTRKQQATSDLTVLNISPRQRLNDVVKTIDELPFGGTDCALPMLYAIEKDLEVDAFVVYTDNETWAGNIHPVQALQQYRQKTGIPAKLVVVGMIADAFSIADPNDAGMLDVVGFDTAAPNVISDFIRS